MDKTFEKETNKTTLSQVYSERKIDVRSPLTNIPVTIMIYGAGLLERRKSEKAEFAQCQTMKGKKRDVFPRQGRVGGGGDRN